MKKHFTISAILFAALPVLTMMATAQPAAKGAPSSTAPQSLDFEFYKTRVEPIFLKKRPGHARCYVCHSVRSPLRLQKLTPGATSWTEEQSRRNFEAISQRVTPGDPLNSRLLMHPLSPLAGGDPYHHQGGRQFESQDDPDWIIMAEWVRGGAAGLPNAQTTAPSTVAKALDFEFYKTRVEPLFLEKRVGHERCYACHSGSPGTVAGADSAFLLEILSPGTTSWTEEQSRHNFGVVSHLVTPGDPLKSRLLMHPLSPLAGGDHYHRGGRQFASQKDPDWLMLAEWVRGQRAGDPFGQKPDR